MTAEELEAGKDFGRYKDVDGDGIPWRTYPGTHPTKGSFFTRGTTRNPYARTPSRADYIYNMERLLRKVRTARHLVPQPVLRRGAAHALGVIYFGSTSPAMDEALDVLEAAGVHLDAMRLRAFPFPSGGPSSSPPTTGVRGRAEPRRQMRSCWSTSWRSIRHADQGAALRRHAHHRALHHPGSQKRWPNCKGSAQASQGGRMTYIAKPRLHHPTLTKNKVGYTRRDYEGKISTLCAGCGHDSISAAIIQACWELDIEPHRVAKLSGIGCSSKTPDYFLGASHGFNTVHGRMPSVLTGANLANRDLLYLGVSGDGDSASIGLGQFAHAMRRGVNMAYIVENNGVYGLTKGQFSATADRGSQEQEGRRSTTTARSIWWAGAATGRHLRGAQLLRRQGTAGAADQGRHGHGGAAFIDVISPCVAFNNHAGSTKSYDYVREHNEAVSRIDFIKINASLR
jgi:2-oxoglutarate ferredoxin oxidoreductase subunit beta